MHWRIALAASALLALIAGDVALPSVPREETATEDPGRVPVERLLTGLNSRDGHRRMAATREFLRRDLRGSAELKRRGAHSLFYHPYHVEVRRMDAVYSLLDPGDSNLVAYSLASFHLYVDKKSADAEVQALGQRHGFTVSKTLDRMAPNFNKTPDGTRVYLCTIVALPPKGTTDDGHLRSILRALLTREPSVVSFTLRGT